LRVTERAGVERVQISSSRAKVEKINTRAEAS
jgi:hypothetical protein